MRQKIRSLRRTLEPAVRQSASVDLARRVSAMAEFAECNSMAAYTANEGEMDPAPLIEAAWDAGKEVYLPIISADRLLRFGRYRKDTPLLPRTFGILEPLVGDDECISPERIDLVLTPLVAFDHNCNRVGMGGGYYDHTFQFLGGDTVRETPKLLGVAYELQRIPHIEQRPWDIRLHAVATERHLYFPSTTHHQERHR